MPRHRPALLDADYLGAFPRGMRELGYIEGENLVIEWRFADGKFERLPGLAAELVRLNVDVIVTNGTPATKAAKEATATIPIVMGNVNDPLKVGFVKSLAHPGANITGLSVFPEDVTPKHLEMLLSMIPGLSRVAYLMNPFNSFHVENLSAVQATASKAGVKILPVSARTVEEIDNAFSMMAKERAAAVILGADALFTQEVRKTAELAAKYRLPAISGLREYVEAGGLVSYGVSRAYNFRRAANYVDKILKGAKPADLPVEQPTTLEMVVNLRTAKALGLSIPQSVLLRADSVIE